MSTIERTVTAVETKSYSYEAIYATLLAALPYVPDLINWVLNDPTAPVVPPEWKKYLGWASFAFALYARSIVVRKPKGTPAIEPVGSDSAAPDDTAV